jgi:hypothetical protein
VEEGEGGGERERERERGGGGERESNRALVIFVRLILFTVTGM